MTTQPTAVVACQSSVVDKIVAIARFVRYNRLTSFIQYTVPATFRQQFRKYYGYPYPFG